MIANNKPAKVVFTLPALHPGGAERVLITLMNGLDRKKYAPSFLCISSRGGLKELIAEDIPFFCLNTRLSPTTLPALYKKLKKLKPDIIVSTMAHMNFAVLAMKPFFPKTKFIVREAITPSFLFQKYKPLDFLIKGLYKTLYPSADLILSPTQKVFDEFESTLQLIHPHTAILKNPVDIEKIRQESDLPPVSDIRRKTVHFVACGRLGHQKGFDRLIKHLPTMKLPFEWKLDILGEGEERQTLESLIKKHGLENNVYLIGLIKAPYKHFAAADCFLMPSRFEGLPNVALEALACGTPVIATKESGGIDEIAADAPNADITLVNTMDDFIRSMEKVTPSPKTTFPKSQLPKIYEEQRVLKDFNTLIKMAD